MYFFSQNEYIFLGHSISFPPYPAAPSNSTQSTIGQREAPAVSGSMVAYPVVVFGPSWDSPQTRSVDSSSGHDLAPSAGFSLQFCYWMFTHGWLCAICVHFVILEVVILCVCVFWMRTWLILSKMMVFLCRVLQKTLSKLERVCKQV